MIRACPSVYNGPGRCPIYDIVKRIAYKYKDIDGIEYEDLCQEGYIIALQAERDYCPSKGAKLSSYIYAKVHWALVDYIREQLGRTRIKNRPQYVELNEHLPARNEFTIDFYHWLENLPARYQKILIMKACGFSYEEIGKATGYTHLTVITMVSELKHQWNLQTIQ